MLQKYSPIRKCAFGFAAMFLFVYLLDYVPGIMAENGKMFGLFSMTPIVDLGHLVLGALALISALTSAKLCRIYFYLLGVWYAADVVIFFVSHFESMSLIVNILVNLPHTIISVAAFWIARTVEIPAREGSRLHATQANP